MFSNEIVQNCTIFYTSIPVVDTDIADITYNQKKNMSFISNL